MELSERHIKQLESEGFQHVYEWFDEPRASYPAHTHDTKHSIFICEGSMSVRITDTTTTYASGNRLDIPAGTVHAIMIGPEGCKYVIGE